MIEFLTTGDMKRFGPKTFPEEVLKLVVVLNGGKVDRPKTESEDNSPSGSKEGKSFIS